MNDYVEKKDDGFWVRGKRVSLDSVVYAFRRGQSPESIRRSFSLLSLEEIYGAIAYYLSNQAAIDSYLLADEAEFEQMRSRSQNADADWYGKMRRARADMLVSKG
jgi:uncharacterized protein (DUF433 family)